MDLRTIRFGLAVGLIGGALMALWAMLALAITGNGIWTPLNLIAHTFWHDAPLDGQFSLAAMTLGLMVHLTISAIVGTVIASFVVRGALDGGVLFVVALAVGFSAWMVQAFAWPSIDSAASNAFTPWVLATAHVVFALGAARALERLLRTHEPRTTRPLFPAAR